MSKAFRFTWERTNALQHRLLRSGTAGPGSGDPACTKHWHRHCTRCPALRESLWTLLRVQGKHMEEGCCARQATLNASVADFFREHQLERLGLSGLSQWTTTDHRRDGMLLSTTSRLLPGVAGAPGTERANQEARKGDQVQESAVQASTEAKASDAEAALAIGWVAPTVTGAQAGVSR